MEASKHPPEPNPDSKSNFMLQHSLLVTSCLIIPEGEPHP